MMFYSYCRLWAEVFHVTTSGSGTVKWQQVRHRGQQVRQMGQHVRQMGQQVRLIGQQVRQMGNR